MADIARIRLPNEAEAREIKDAIARRVFTPATSSTLGNQGQVPAPSWAEVQAGEFLCADGTWKAPSATVAVDNAGTVTNTIVEEAVLVSGTGMTITPDTTNHTITFEAAGTTYTEGTGIDITTGDVINNTGILNITSDNTGSTAAAGTITITKLNSAGTATEETEVAVKGLADAAYKGVDNAITSSSTSANVPTSDVVYGFVNTFGNMKYIGSLGNGSGQTAALPVDGSANVGDYYDVAVAGTYGGEAAIVGDTYVCLTKTTGANTWKHIAQTDTTYTADNVTISISNANVISANAATATTAGVVTLSTAIPSSGATDTVVPTQKAVADAIAGITGPMIFKGAATIGSDGSITVPGTVTTIKQGFTFKVTEVNASYSGTLKVGDTLIADKDDPTTTSLWVENTDWTVIPSGDEEAATYPKFEFITDYVYTRVATATTWTANTYYSRSGDTYTLTTSEPADWDTNYNSYYTKSAQAGTLIGVAYSA